ncbi:Glycylpeptide N-tetradecanoyltransferase [Papiliotrema laurentii]|uniref:Glycylpeptide N-tetradecanoyltransferase n=1 Tax=Papiliotrema laurentii TaxID=5418 RepID=A0AAD9FTL3_PAPLA|nr:Glycylpeptide N-tetradecanoyltransferase [Papiliotrema laurentii]
MPLPQDDTLPANSQVFTSHTEAPVTELSTSEVLQKFKQLGVDAAAEEEDDDEDDEEHEPAAAGAAGPGGEAGAGGEGGKKKKKKKKGKSKASKAVDKLKNIATGGAPQELIDAVRDNMDASEQGATDEDIKKALKAIDLMKILEGQVALGNKSNSKNLGEHKFWNTQPVPQLPTASSSSSIPTEGPIDKPKTPADVKQEPGALPSGFEWSLIDIKNEAQCEEVHTLLSENYVEDDDAMFRFRYSKEFLLWALTAPGYLPEWHIGVRVVKTGKLVAFISGINIDIRVRSQIFPAAEINFLCVHKKLRSKRLTPVLIKEVTRRVNLTNVWQAIYTAGVVLPTPFGTSRYFHRNLNPPKLVDIGFSPLGRNQTISRLVRHYAVPSHPQIPGFREMVAADVPQVGELLRRYLARFDIAQTFSKDEEIAHWFLSGQGREVNGERVEQVVWAYVVEDPTTHLITDLVSFYSLPSTIMKHKNHNVLNAAYMFYYASDVISSPGGSADDAATHDAKSKAKLGERLNALVSDLLVIAKNAGFDVVNALTMADNNMFLNDQKFGPGDGFLNYYLYNWSCAGIDGGARGTANRQGSGIGIVML